MIRNLTPHIIRVRLRDGTYREFPPAGLARVKDTMESLGELESIPVFAKHDFRTSGLPPPEEGTYFIVSSFVKIHNLDRKDLLTPTEVRDGYCLAFWL